MMSSLASLVVRHRRAVIMIWAALLIGAGAFGSSAFSVLSSSFGAGPSTEARGEHGEGRAADGAGADQQPGPEGDDRAAAANDQRGE